MPASAKQSQWRRYLASPSSSPLFPSCLSRPRFSLATRRLSSCFALSSGDRSLFLGPRARFLFRPASETPSDPPESPAQGFCGRSADDRASSPEALRCAAGTSEGGCWRGGSCSGVEDTGSGELDRLVPREFRLGCPQLAESDLEVDAGLWKPVRFEVLKGGAEACFKAGELPFRRCGIRLTRSINDLARSIKEH